MTRSRWGFAVLLAASCCISSYAHAAACGPVMNGTVLFIATECLNDSMALVVDSSKADAKGWQYSVDSSVDAVDGGVLSGGMNEMYGMAFRETQTGVWIVLNANMPLAGKPFPTAQGGSITWGDLMINMTGSNFVNANNARALYAIRFAEANDSNGQYVGLYKNVYARSVTSINSGFLSWQSYYNYCVSKGVTPTLGELGSAQTYYDPGISCNEIDTGALVGAIQLLTQAQVAALGYDTTRFPGSQTIAIYYEKKLIIDQCGVVGGDGTSCVDCAGVCGGTAVKDSCGVCNGGDKDKG